MRWALRVQPNRQSKPEVFTRRRIVQEDQPGHPRLEDQSLPVLKNQDDAFAEPLDGLDASPDQTPVDRGGRGGYLDRPLAARIAKCAFDSAPADPQDSTPHRFDFG